MIRFGIYRQRRSSNILMFVGRVELEVIYCSQAIVRATEENLITEPGRYLVVRYDVLKEIEEIQIYDVDYASAPLKICKTLRDEIPTPVPLKVEAIE